MALLVWILYLFIGLGLIEHFFPQVANRSSLYLRAYFVASLFMIFYHYFAIYELDKSMGQNFIGIFSKDGIFYHTVGEILSQEGFNFVKVASGGWTIAWQYIVAIHYYIFGVNVLLPKIFSVFTLSIASIGFYCLSQNISNSVSAARRSYYLIITCLPLLYGTVDLLRDVFIWFLIIMSLYSFKMLEDKKSAKWLVWLVIFGFLMGMTRIEYVLLLFALFFLNLILSTKLKLFNKIIIIIITTIFFYALFSLPIIQQANLLDTIRGQDSGRARRIGLNLSEFIYVKGYINYIKAVIENLAGLLKVIIYGIFIFIFYPAPTKAFSAYQDFGRFFFEGLYNMFFYFLVPAIYYGIKYKFKRKLFTRFDFIILTYIFIVLIGVTLNWRDVGRYRLPVRPLLLLYASHGLEYLKHWKTKMPIIIVVLLIAYYLFASVLKIDQILGVVN